MLNQSALNVDNKNILYSCAQQYNNGTLPRNVFYNPYYSSYDHGYMLPQVITCRQHLNKDKVVHYTYPIAKILQIVLACMSFFITIMNVFGVAPSFFGLFDAGSWISTIQGAFGGQLPLIPIFTAITLIATTALSVINTALSIASVKGKYKVASAVSACVLLVLHLLAMVLTKSTAKLQFMFFVNCAILIGSFICACTRKR